MKRTCSFVLTVSLAAFSLSTFSISKSYAQELQQVFDAPEMGTFYLLSADGSEGGSPPYPYDPYGGVIPVFQMPGVPNSYVVADTIEDFQTLKALQFGVQSLDGGGMSTMSGDGLPEFPEGEGGSEWEGGTNYFGMVFSTNDLYVTLVPDSFTNGTAALAIHNPEGETNEPPAWLVWAVTNVSFCTDPWALDADNWAWVASTVSGQTNVTVPVLSDLATFYRLADPFNDADFDGIPDAYSWAYFGRQRGWADNNSRPQDDFDGDGISNGLEYTNSTDPNSISFTAHVGYGHVSVTNPTATITLLGGVPAEVAVLVNSTNFDGAVWQPYTAAPIIPLPDGEGEHQVWMSLRARVPAEFPDWFGFAVTLDQTPPDVEITSPTNGTTSKPIIQLQGWSTDAVWSVSCTLSNAAGVQTNLMGYVTRKDFGAVTTNHFQCFDLELTNGVNALTLLVMDRAENTTSTNLSVTFDTAGDTNAPELTLLWPQAGTQLGADTFVLRGRVDDETAEVGLSIVGTNGVTNSYSGTVERNGAVWVESVALEPGTNWVTLSAMDAATNVATTNFVVVRSAVVITINEVSASELNNPFVTVTGTVSDSSYSVWVNGVQATVNGNGTWVAYDVPVTPGGSAVFAVRGIPNGGSGTPGAPGFGDPSESNPSDPDAVDSGAEPEKDAETVLVRGKWERKTNSRDYGDLGSGETTYNSNYAWQWDEVEGGYAEAAHRIAYPNSSNLVWGVRYWLSTNGEPRFEGWEDETNNVTWTEPADLASVFWAGFTVKGPLADGRWATETADHYGTYSEERVVKELDVRLRTGGRSAQNAENLFVATATAQELTPAGEQQLLPQTQVIDSFGPQGTDAQAYAMHPDNIETSVKVQAPAAYYTFTVGATKHRLTILANGISLLTNRPVFCVGQRITFQPSIEPALPPEATKEYKWSMGGTFVNASNQPCEECSVSYTNLSSLLTNELCHAWWVSGEYNPDNALYAAELSGRLTFTNGYTTEFDIAGRFRMHRPRFVDYTLASLPIQATLSHYHSYGVPDPFDHLGALPPAEFWVGIDSAFDGTAGIT